MTNFYYKVRQVLQILTIITKWDKTEELTTVAGLLILMIWFASVTNRFGFNYEVVKTMSSFAHCAHISIENNTPHPWPGSWKNI